MVGPSLLAPLESVLNRNIAASTPARELLRELNGRAFAVEIGTPEGGRLLRLRLNAEELGLRVARSEEPADATVSGTPLALASLLMRRAQGARSAGGVAISGDAAVAEAFEKLLGLARPDFEEELARLAGDVPAHYAGLVLRGALGWLGQARDSLARNAGEFLTEESRDLVARGELEAFHGDVDALREDVERAAARLAALQRQRGAAP
jgi:ubiquinone biosynthesis protein UbiJ